MNLAPVFWVLFSASWMTQSAPSMPLSLSETIPFFNPLHRRLKKSRALLPPKHVYYIFDIT